MKYSTAMLKGYQQVGKQCKHAFYNGDRNSPTSVCALGAVAMGTSGDAACIGFKYPTRARVADKFFHSYGVTIAECNDSGMPIPDIAGMLKAIGE